MSFFRTPNPWLLAAGAAHNVGQTYGNTMVDIARIRAMQDAQAREDAWRRDQAATADTRWNIARQSQEQELDLRRQALAQQIAAQQAAVKRQTDSDTALTSFAQNIGSLTRPSQAPPVGPVLPQMSPAQAMPLAFSATPNAGMIDPRMLDAITKMATGASEVGGSAVPTLSRIPGTDYGVATFGKSVIGNSLMSMPEGQSPQLVSQMVDPALLENIMTALSKQIDPNTASDAELRRFEGYRKVIEQIARQGAPWTTNMLQEQNAPTNVVRRYIPGKGLQ